MNKIISISLFFLGVLLGSIFFPFNENSSYSGNDLRLFRIPILDSCVLNEISFDKIGEWRFVSFDMRNEVINSRGYLELYSEEIPSEVLKKVNETIMACNPKYFSKYDSYGLLSYDIQKYFDISKNGTVYIKIDKRNAVVSYNEEIE